MATTAEIVCFDHFWSRLKTGQEIDVNDRQNFIYWDEDRSSDLVDETFRINQMDNKKKIYRLYISFFDAQIQLFSFVIGIRSIHISFFFLEKEKARWIKISQGFDFSRGRMMERIKRRLRALEEGKGKIARTQAHLNGRYTLRWRTCTCVLRLHSFARSLGSSVYLAAKQHTQARAHTYTHWPTRYAWPHPK